MRLIDHVIPIALAAGFVMACGEPREPSTQERSNMKELVIPVEGMACDSCANRIRKTLLAIDGVGDTNVSFNDKRVVTHYDPRKLSSDRVVAAIKVLGFKPGAPAEATP